RRRTSREETAPAERQSEQSDKRFDRNDDVGRNPDRADRAVAYGRQRVYAEEEGLQEAAVDAGARRHGQRSVAAEQVSDGEKEIRAEVKERGQAEESPPRHRQQSVVRTERSQKPKPRAHHVETAVAVEQPLATFSRHHRAESQIAHVGLITS